MGAETRVTQHGKVGVKELLAIEPRNETFVVEPPKVEQEAENAVPSCCAAKTCSKTNPESAADCSVEEVKTRAETRFGITSFVYSTERMMSRSKLMKEMGKWQKARAA